MESMPKASDLVTAADLALDRDATRQAAGVVLQLADTAHYAGSEQERPDHTAQKPEYASGKHERFQAHLGLLFGRGALHQDGLFFVLHGRDGLSQVLHLAVAVLQLPGEIDGIVGARILALVFPGLLDPVGQHLELIEALGLRSVVGGEFTKSVELLRQFLACGKVRLEERILLSEQVAADSGLAVHQ